MKEFKGTTTALELKPVDRFDKHYEVSIHSSGEEVAVFMSDNAIEAKANAQLFLASKEMADVLIAMIRRVDDFKDSVGDNIYNGAKQALEKAGLL